jgi:hypothetical protein
MSKPKQVREKKAVPPPAAAARQLWDHLKRADLKSNAVNEKGAKMLGVEAALAALVPDDSARSAFDIKKSAD